MFVVIGQLLWGHYNTSGNDLLIMTHFTLLIEL